MSRREGPAQSNILPLTISLVKVATLLNQIVGVNIYIKFTYRNPQPPDEARLSP